MTKTTESFFLDASALIPFCVPAGVGAPSYLLMRRHGQMVVWWGTSVEMCGAFARLLRSGVLTGATLNTVLVRFARLRDAWFEILPGERLRRLAETIPDKYNLRAGNPRGRPFVCFDQRLAKAAEAAGFEVLRQP